MSEEQLSCTLATNGPHQGQFKLSDGTVLGREFSCVITGKARERYRFQPVMAHAKNPLPDMLWSYDGDLNDEALRTVLSKWNDRGWSYITHKYLECDCRLIDGRQFKLLVPPASTQSLVSYLMMLGLRDRLGWPTQVQAVQKEGTSLWRIEFDMNDDLTVLLQVEAQAKKALRTVRMALKEMAHKHGYLHLRDLRQRRDSND